MDPSRPPTPFRIAFGGRMQVGKTSAAERLVERHGFVRHALADPIKEIATGTFGWDGRKDDRGRRLLQESGDVGRHYDPEHWLDRYAARLAAEPSARVTVDDVRLPREVEALEALGFTIVLIRRPDAPGGAAAGAARGAHGTETGLDGLDLPLAIDNDGSLADLAERVDALVARLGVEGFEGGRDGVPDSRRAPSERGPRPVGQEETQA